MRDAALTVMCLLCLLCLLCLATACGNDASGSAVGVGAPCLPELIPVNGFNRSDTYIQTGSDQCQTGICMVFKLRGNPNPDTCSLAMDCNADPDNADACFQQRCASSEEVKDRVYCTCQCDGGCKCPSGFSCVDVGSDLGSYCTLGKTLL